MEQRHIATINRTRDNALKITDTYVIHYKACKSTEKINEQQILVKSLKVMAKYGDFFWGSMVTRNIIKDPHNTFRIASEKTKDGGESNQCTCNVCKFVDKIDKEYEKWAPTDELSIILKTAIDSLPK